MDPNWDATLRVSKIPTTPGEFGSDGQSILSVRQSRFGVQADQQIAGKRPLRQVRLRPVRRRRQRGPDDLPAAELLRQVGSAADRPDRHALVMDGDIFPNTIDYWGPTGMVFLRNPQIRFTWKSGPNELAGAIEKPSNDVDPGEARDRRPGSGGRARQRDHARLHRPVPVRRQLGPRADRRHPSPTSASRRPERPATSRTAVETRLGRRRHLQPQDQRRTT